MSTVSATANRPFIDHLRELQIRLSLICLSIALFAGLAFAYNEVLLKIIQAPLNQTLYFTSPTGGLSFIFQLCVTVGIIISFPVIIHQFYKFVQPLMSSTKRSAVFGYAVASFVLACLGGLFAYYISLPMALHFLVQFGGTGIESLIKADEYFSFALAYIGGFALLFQIPLITLIINRIKPLKPKKMMGAQRWIILISFIVAAILTPTPDPINQTLMAAPAITLYQMSIMMIFFVNRTQPRKSRTVQNEPADATTLSEKNAILSESIPTESKPSRSSTPLRSSNQGLRAARRDARTRQSHKPKRMDGIARG